MSFGWRIKQIASQEGTQSPASQPCCKQWHRVIYRHQGPTPKFTERTRCFPLHFQILLLSIFLPVPYGGLCLLLRTSQPWFFCQTWRFKGIMDCKGLPHSSSRSHPKLNQRRVVVSKGINPLWLPDLESDISQTVRDGWADCTICILNSPEHLHLAKSQLSQNHGTLRNALGIPFPG